jgi:hypothetical protein
MSIMQRVKERIAEMPPGQLVTYADFEVKEAEFMALAAALSRLARQGLITRYGKGHYYKPKVTVFGPISPQENEIVSTLVNQKKNRATYEGGLGLYNRLGLTTQIPKEITMVTNVARKTATRRSARVGKTKVNIIESPIDFKAQDIDKLEILDAIRGIKKIAASNTDEVCRILLSKLATYKEEDIIRMIALAKDYNPGTKALLGALLAKLGFQELTGPLRKQLNPLSSYRLGISEQILPNKKDWRIT